MAEHDKAEPDKALPDKALRDRLRDVDKDRFPVEGSRSPFVV